MMIILKTIIAITIPTTNNLQLYCTKYSYPILIILNGSIWPKNGTLTSTTTKDQSEPGSISNEEVLHTH